MVSGASRHSDHGASTEPATTTSAAAMEDAIFPPDTHASLLNRCISASMGFLGLAASSGAAVAKGVVACRLSGTEAHHRRQHHDE